MDSSQIISAKAPGKPWDFWMSMLFYVITTITVICMQSLVSVFMVISFWIFKAREPEQIFEYAKSLEGNGLFLGIATCFSASVFILIPILLAYLKKDMTIGEYLAFRKIKISQVCKWVSLLLLFIVCTDSLSFFLDKDVVPQVMLDSYRTAYFMPLLLFAVIIVAPVSEEIFFRGFLFKGIQESKLGSPVAIIITSLLWSILHLQYDLYFVTLVFCGGIIIGIARYKTGSVITAILMHMFMNIVATLEVIYILN